jgi:hypothetical protein
MKQKIFIYLFLFVFDSAFAQLDTVSIHRDSVVLRRFRVNPSLSFTYLQQNNWQTITNSAISVFSNISLRHTIQRTSGWRHDYLFQADLSYIHLSDSTWIKNTDLAKLNMQWYEPKGVRFTHTYGVLFITQFLNSYKLHQESERRYWSGGFLNPATLSLMYGINVNFLKNSKVDVNFASVKLDLLPRALEKNIQTVSIDNILVKTKHTYINSAYGFSAMLTMEESFFNNSLILENNSILFFNALNRAQINLDINNRIAIRFFKFMQLKFDTRIVYNPNESFKLQYRQEVLLGVFYEHKTKSRKN